MQGMRPQMFGNMQVCRFLARMWHGVDAAVQQQPGSAAAAVQGGHSYLSSFAAQYQGGQMGSGMLYSNTGAGTSW
jgi:hypothetical protein